MNLSNESITYLQNVLTTAQLVGVEALVVEPGIVRGMDEGQSVFILHTKDVPDMEFGSIGLTRLSSLTSRLNIAKDLDNFNIEAAIVTEDDGSTFARSLTIKGKGLKIDYRCAKPAQLISSRQAGPKQMNDKMEFCVEFDKSCVDMLQKGQAAMKSDEVSIISNDGVSFELLDVNNDVFAHQFAEDAINLEGADTTKFAYRYPTKILLMLLKNASEELFTISHKGILCISINGLNVYVLPQV